MTVIEEYERLAGLINAVALPDGEPEIRIEAVVLLGAEALTLMRNPQATFAEAVDLAKGMMNEALNGGTDGATTTDV